MSRKNRTSFEGLLAIGQPNTPEKRRLPYAETEFSDIKLLGTAEFPIVGLLGEDATIEKVVKGMTAELGPFCLPCHPGRFGAD
jgi:hypothetical protein